MASPSASLLSVNGTTFGLLTATAFPCEDGGKVGSEAVPVTLYTADTTQPGVPRDAALVLQVHLPDEIDEATLALNFQPLRPQECTWAVGTDAMAPGGSWGAPTAYVEYNTSSFDMSKIFVSNTRAMQLKVARNTSARAPGSLTLSSGAGVNVNSPDTATKGTIRAQLVFTHDGMAADGLRERLAKEFAEADAKIQAEVERKLALAAEKEALATEGGSVAYAASLDEQETRVARVKAEIAKAFRDVQRNVAFELTGKWRRVDVAGVAVAAAMAEEEESEESAGGAGGLFDDDDDDWGCSTLGGDGGAGGLDDVLLCGGPTFRSAGGASARRRGEAKGDMGPPSGGRAGSSATAGAGARATVGGASARGQASSKTRAGSGARTSGVNPGQRGDVTGSWSEMKSKTVYSSTAHIVRRFRIVTEVAPPLTPAQEADNEAASDAAQATLNAARKIYETKSALTSAQSAKTAASAALSNKRASISVGTRVWWQRLSRELSALAVTAVRHFLARRLADALPDVEAGVLEAGIETGLSRLPALIADGVYGANDRAAADEHLSALLSATEAAAVYPALERLVQASEASSAALAPLSSSEESTRGGGLFDDDDDDW